MNSLINIEDKLQIKYPQLIHEIISYQNENYIDIKYENFLHGKFLIFKFFTFVDVEIDRYLAETIDYEGDFDNPVNMYLQTKLILTNSPTSYQDNGQNILPFARDISGDRTTYLYVGQNNLKVYLMNIEGNSFPLYEVAPSLEMFLGKEGGKFKMTQQNNNFYLNNRTQIKEFYVAEEQAKYGKIVAWDAEGFDELNSYKSFFIEILNVLTDGVLQLTGFNCREDGASIDLSVNDTSFLVSIKDVDGWLDESFIEQLNVGIKSISELQFIIIKDSKLIDQGIRIAAKQN